MLVCHTDEASGNSLICQIHGPWVIFLCCVKSCHVSLYCFSNYIFHLHCNFNKVCMYLCYAMLCFFMSFYVMSCHVMSCHAMPCHVMSCHVMSCHVMLCYVMLCYLMSKFMGHDLSNPLFISGWGYIWFKEQIPIPVGYESPVLHSTVIEIRNGDHIWEEARRSTTSSLQIKFLVLSVLVAEKSSLLVWWIQHFSLFCRPTACHWSTDFTTTSSPAMHVKL